MYRTFLLGLSLLVSLPCRGADLAPENLALKAQVSASSELDPQYAAQLACDGVIPQAMSHADEGNAWCASGNYHPDGVLFTLIWHEPVHVAEIVYYGRTAFDWRENWRDFEIYVDDGSEAVVKGTLKSGHGPQRITLPKPSAVQHLTVKFHGSYGATNPGAAEIQVYSAPASAEMLGPFVEPPAGAVVEGAVIERAVDLQALRRAIEDLCRDFPRRYPKGQEFLKRLGDLERRERESVDEGTLRSDAAVLQSEALLAQPTQYGFGIET